MLPRCQKAPSTRRCIKTLLNPPLVVRGDRQKAPSTRRCIKTGLSKVWLSV